MKILLMDDDLVFARLTGRLLSSLGYTAETVSKGEDAIAAYNSKRETGSPFDVVILDIHVKDGMGGGETIKNLIAADPGVRAIVSSADIKNPIMRNFNEYGFVEALPKPYDIHELGALLTRVSMSSPGGK